MNWKRDDGCLKDEFLQQYIDGELNVNQSEEIKNHLAECDSCKLRIRAQKKIIKELISEFNSLNLKSMEIPEFSSLKKSHIHPRNKMRYFQWSAAAILLLLITVFTVKKLMNSKETEKTYIVYEFDNESDANKPWSEQPMSIYIFDDSGKILDEINL